MAEGDEVLEAKMENGFQQILNSAEARFNKFLDAAAVRSVNVKIENEIIGKYDHETVWIRIS